MWIRPVNDYLLVKCIKIQRKSRLGIILDHEPKDSIFGEVQNSDKYNIITFLNKKNLFELNGEEYCLIKEDEILSVE